MLLLTGHKKNLPSKKNHQPNGRGLNHNRQLPSNPMVMVSQTQPKAPCRLLMASPHTTKLPTANSLTSNRGFKANSLILSSQLGKDSLTNSRLKTSGDTRNNTLMGSQGNLITEVTIPLRQDPKTILSRELIPTGSSHTPTRLKEAAIFLLPSLILYLMSLIKEQAPHQQILMLRLLFLL